MPRASLRTLSAAILSLILTCTTQTSSAQVPAGILTGVVRDTTGRPLRGVGVALDPEGTVRVARTDQNGRFRFGNVPAGRHSLRVTWIGYRPDDRLIVLSESGLHIELRLVPLARRLDPMKIVARRTGALGTVLARPTVAPLQGASVIVMNTAHRTRTADDGRFAFPNLREGAYVVAVRRDGFRSRLIPIAIPATDAVEIAAMLDPITKKSERLMEQRLRDIDSRISRHSRNTMAIIARQELTILPESRLDEALRYAPSLYSKGLIANSLNICRLYVDGREESFLQLRDFSPTSIEMLEVYEVRGCAASASELAVGSPMTRSRRPRVLIYVWLRH